MSKFFVEGNISDEEDEDEREENENQRGKEPNYQYDFMDDYTAKSGKRVVRTEKEKKWSAIKDLTVKIGTALNNEDFEKVWELLQELLKEKEKAVKLIDKEGYPSFFLRCLKRVKDEIQEFSKSQAKKKMKKHSAIAFNTMNQKMKKIYPEYQNEITDLIEKGIEEEEEHQEQEQESSSSSSDDEDDITLLESPDPMVRRKYWLKKPKRKVTEEEDQEKQKEKEKEKEKEKQKDEQKKAGKKEPKVINVTERKKAAAEIQSIKDAENRMKEIRKNFMKLNNQEDREEYLLTLDKISDKTKEAKDFEKLSFYLLDIPIRIDVCRQMKLNYFPRTQWIKLYSTIKQIHHLLRESEEDDLVENIRLFEDTNNANENVSSAVTEEVVYLSLKSYLILIEGEIKKALVFLESTSVEYYERLQDLIGLVDVMYKISKELQIKDGYEKDAAELAFKVLENAYFMDSGLIERIKKELKVDVQFLQLADQSIIEEYANSILKYRSEEQTKIKTLLYLIYNHTINGRDKGKELMVISTLSETIHSQDYQTQVLYNRALVQMGILAFKQGNIFEVQQYLYQMCSMAKMKQNTKDVLKQFLAQGFSRLYGDKDIPKNKVIPAYLHLNTEVIESIELVASMLLETPYTLMEGGRITTKTFKRFIYEYEKNFFIEEKLNNRDLIYAASLALKEGEWKECYDHLEQLSIWSAFPEADETKLNLLRIVKEQSLKCYLISNRKCFKSIALAGLSEKFALEEKTIKKHICKLISDRNIQGSITRAGYLIFVQKKQTEMQKICENFFEKVKEMTEASQLWFSQKTSTGYDSDEEKEEHGIARKGNLAINEKLKAILSKRTDKY